MSEIKITMDEMEKALGKPVDFRDVNAMEQHHLHFDPEKKLFYGDTYDMGQAEDNWFFLKNVPIYGKKDRLRDIYFLRRTTWTDLPEKRRMSLLYDLMEPGDEEDYEPPLTDIIRVTKGFWETVDRKKLEDAYVKVLMDSPCSPAVDKIDSLPLTEYEKMVMRYLWFW